MSALVLDAGALIAVDRNDRRMLARLRVAQKQGLEIRTHPFVVAQVWREGTGRQANLARLLKATDVVPVDDALGRSCGVLLGRAGTSDPVDAAVVLVARPGDRIATSDVEDIGHLAATAGRAVVLVPV